MIWIFIKDLAEWYLWTRSFLGLNLFVKDDGSLVREQVQDKQGKGSTELDSVSHELAVNSFGVLIFVLVGLVVTLDQGPDDGNELKCPSMKNVQ